MGEIEAMRRRMSRMLEDMVGRHPLEEEMSLELFTPAVDVYTTDTEVVVKAELPGMDIKDVTVEIAENRLILSGQSQRESEVKEENYFRSERSFGSFRRIIQLPERVRDEETKATFENGVLTIRAPLVEPTERKAKKIQIETKGGSQQIEGLQGQAQEAPEARQPQGAPEQQQQSGPETGSSQQQPPSSYVG